MWLPTPTSDQIAHLRSQMEAEFLVPLSEEQWAAYATQLLQTFYLAYLYVPRKLHRAPEQSQVDKHYEL